MDSDQKSPQNSQYAILAETYKPADGKMYQLQCFEAHLKALTESATHFIKTPLQDQNADNLKIASVLETSVQ